MKTLLAIAAVAVAIATAGPAWGDTFITDTLAPGGGHSSPYDAQPQSPAFITDTLAPGGGGVDVQSSPAPTGFSWPDAGVGAAAGFGGMLALLGIGLLAARRRPGLAV